MNANPNTQPGTYTSIYDTQNPALWSVFNAIPFGIIILDEYGHLADVNDSYCNLSGYCREELIGHHFLTFVPETKRSNFQQQFNDVINGKGPSPLHIECCLQQKDGHVLDVYSSIVLTRLPDEALYVYISVMDMTQHKRSEEIVFLEQSKYRALVNNNMYAFFFGKPDGTILETNAKASELFGYTEEEFKKLHRKDIIHHNNELQKRMKERKMYGYTQGELIGIKKNGEHFPCQFSSVFFKDLNGEDRTSTILLDITEKKKAEEEIKKLSRIAHETISPIVITDVDRRIQWVNAAFTRITEYTLEEAVGKRPEDFLYGQETDMQAVQELQENKRAGRTFESELLMYSKSGRKYWITMQAQPEFDSTGKLIGYFAIGIESTERKKNEAQIAHNQQLLQQAERIAELGSWENDLKTGITIWSDELYRIYGWEPGDIESTLERQLSIIHPDDRERVQAILQATIEGKGDFDFEKRIVQPNGNIRIIHAQGTLITNRLGEPEKLIGVAHDITRHKQLEKQLVEEKVNRQRQIARATINTQEKERSEIGKELHDNVNQILASAKLFLSSPFLDGNDRDVFINKSVEHINMAIEEIRKLSKSLVSPSAADLGIIETINDLIGDIKLAQKIDVCFSHIGIDESKLDNGLKLTIYRIVQEQVNNILKYAEASSIEIYLNEENKKLLLTITDNGKGFDPAEKRKGIGLNNIINRADVFNGKVELHTAPGKGCCLKVIFDTQNWKS